ncbi:MAG: DUF485 domain-containing protein [Gammaproteobacteria bacterium]
MEALYRHIDANPAFHRLQKRRSRFNWGLALTMLGTYYAFILTVAFKPGLFAIPLYVGTVINWGILAALAVIVVSLLLTIIYVIRSNREFDPEAQAIIDRAVCATADDADETGR